MLQMFLNENLITYWLQIQITTINIYSIRTRNKQFVKKIGRIISKIPQKDFLVTTVTLSALKLILKS